MAESVTPSTCVCVHWITRDGMGPPADWDHALSLAGLRSCCEEPPALRVLVVALEGDKEWFDDAMHTAPLVPTLVLARGPELQAFVFSRISEQDDVDSPDKPAFVLAARLAMMQRRTHVAKALHAQQRTDQLTGLYNRSMVFKLWQALAEKDLECTVFFLDLDHFKEINDRHGHGVGDEVLRHVSGRLARHLGLGSMLSRLGGDEFIWINFGGSEDDAERLAADALKQLDEPLRTGIGSVEVTASVGYASGRTSGSLQDLLSNADQAVYEAKAKGRGRAVAYTELQRQAAEAEGDVQLAHFENVAKVVTERTANLLTNFGKSLVRRARRDADLDPLTQLWNRGYFDRRFERELSMAQSQRTPLTIVVFDLDHFGQFNRQHGMPTGDAVLQAFAQLLAASIRASDWVARYGGEEFVLVVRGPVDEARQVTDRIRSAFEELEIAAPTGQQVRATVTAGIAVLRHDEPVTGASLVQEGSKRLQQAKRDGRNRVLAPDD